MIGPLIFARASDAARDQARALVSKNTCAAEGSEPAAQAGGGVSLPGAAAHSIPATAGDPARRSPGHGSSDPCISCASSLQLAAGASVLAASFGGGDA